MLAMVGRSALVGNRVAGTASADRGGIALTIFAQRITALSHELLQHAMKADAAERYLAAEISAAGDSHGDIGDCARFRAGLRRAMAGEWHRISEAVLRRDSLSDFNDGCNDFAELRELILQARATAINDADCATTSNPRLEIELDELVMA